MYEMILYINVAALLLLARSMAMPMWTWHSANAFARVKKACKYISWFAVALFVFSITRWFWQSIRVWYASCLNPKSNHNW